MGGVGECFLNKIVKGVGWGGEGVGWGGEGGGTVLSFIAFVIKKFLKICHGFKKFGSFKYML